MTRSGSHRNCIWLNIHCTRADFVRAKNGTEDKARALFGDIAICHAEGVDGEYGFVTEPMTVGDFEEKKSQLDGFIARIFMN